jgi:hypothetical protein
MSVLIISHETHLGIVLLRELLEPEYFTICFLFSVHDAYCEYLTYSLTLWNSATVINLVILLRLQQYFFGNTVYCYCDTERPLSRYTCKSCFTFGRYSVHVCSWRLSYLEWFFCLLPSLLSRLEQGPFFLQTFQLLIRRFDVI